MFKRGLCFDLDGTLIDSGREGLKRILAMAKVKNLPLNADTEQRIRGMWGIDATKLLQATWPNEDLRAFFTELENMEITNPHPLFPGVKETLEKLKPHFYMSIVTNRIFKTASAQLEYNGIVEFFGLIITPEHSGYKKPEPEIMDPVLEKYESVWIGPENIIFVGDTVQADWKLCQNLGLKFYAVLCGGMDTREKFLTAGVPEDHIIDSVSDLPRILLN